MTGEYSIHEWTGMKKHILFGHATNELLIRQLPQYCTGNEIAFRRRQQAMEIRRSPVRSAGFTTTPRVIDLATSIVTWRA